MDIPTPKRNRKTNVSPGGHTNFDDEYEDSTEKLDKLDLNKSSNPWKSNNEGRNDCSCVDEPSLSELRFESDDHKCHRCDDKAEGEDVHDPEEESTEENTNANTEPELETLYPLKSKVGLDDFVLLKLIGQGGYGKVYLVRKKDSNEIFAMKALRKDFLARTNNISYTKTEKDILTKVKHPNIVTMHYAFQCESKVYLVMDFVNGGQVFWHLREQAMFSEAVVKFYAAQIVLAIEHLHSSDIIHRDLKPENILLDAKGNICVTDFGFAKEAISDQNRTNTFCGTIEYMSPEMIKGTGYGKAADWWAVGILLFDMLTGQPPFRSKDESILQKKILQDKIKLPNYLTSECASIIKELLNRDEKKRLGSGPNGIRDIKNHRFFKGMNWKKLANGEIVPPFRPLVNGHDDTTNFDEEFTNQVITNSPASSFTLTESQEQLFKNFSYVRNDDHFPPIITSSSSENVTATN